ncbi:MAG: alkaline phosphatase family protein [Verrucomicrobiota bacterium]|nr:alkaline phosphatase family protein [Verrucomicrobiota bacterium]
MKRTAVLNIVGLTKSLIGPKMPNIGRFVERSGLKHIRPTFPAVTCTAQSTYLTGVNPNQHGIVGNGWYDREYAEHRFWKQSNHLVQSPKLWDVLKQKDSSFTCAKLFWWYNMYADVDYSITPRPMYPADGRKVFDIYTQPMALRETIKQDLGDFPFPNFWGPMAGIQSSKWIAQSAQWIEQKYRPTLNLVYLPHLDYNLQRYGPCDTRVHNDLHAIDTLAGQLIQFFEARDIQVILLSEYGITEVDQPIHLNRLFREQGWITVKDELGLEQLDCGASGAFAIADHQIAHIYLNNPTLKETVRETLLATEGVSEVLDADSMPDYSIDHARAGDLIAIADERSWFTYYYWQDDAYAPDFARCVDIHRKLGYDPVELFIDPNLKFPKLKVAEKLMRKKLGFRTLMDLIPLDALLVRGSHGRIPSDKMDWPVLITDSSHKADTSIGSTDVFQHLLEQISCI